MLNDGFRPHVEVLHDQRQDLVVAAFASAKGVDEYAYGLGDSNSVADLDFALVRQSCGYDVFGDVSRHVGSAAVNFGGVFAAEASAAVAADSSVGVHDDFSSC